MSAAELGTTMRVKSVEPQKIEMLGIRLVARDQFNVKQLRGGYLNRRFLS
jgi:hypothetical protein